MPTIHFNPFPTLGGRKEIYIEDFTGWMSSSHNYSRGVLSGGEEVKWILPSQSPDEVPVIVRSVPCRASFAAVLCTPFVLLNEPH